MNRTLKTAFSLLVLVFCLSIAKADTINEQDTTEITNLDSLKVDGPDEMLKYLDSLNNARAQQILNESLDEEVQPWYVTVLGALVVAISAGAFYYFLFISKPPRK